jgi:hypothetical protein
MSHEILGNITCPHCGNENATVHKQARGKKRLYYRCYDGQIGDCGTVQIVLEGGQKWINKNIRKLNSDNAEILAEEAGILAKEKQQKTANKTKSIEPLTSEGTPTDKKGFFHMLLNE